MTLMSEPELECADDRSICNPLAVVVSNQLPQGNFQPGARDKSLAC